MATRDEIVTDVVSLCGNDDHLSVSTIQTLLQLRYELEYEKMLWSKSLREFTISLVAEVLSTSTTLCDVTNGSATVNFDGTPVVAALDGCQIEIGEEEQYFFLTRVTDSQLTLQDGEGVSVNWPGLSATDQPWRIFKTIYSLPSNADTVISLAGEFPLEEYDGGRDQLDRDDPDRSLTDSHPHYWLYAGVDASGNRKIELHPASTQARILRGQCGRKAPVLTGAMQVDVNRAFITYSTAADCLNTLHAKTGDQSYKDLALFYERKSGEAYADLGPREVEKLSPARTLKMGPRSHLGHDHFVQHQDIDRDL